MVINVQALRQGSGSKCLLPQWNFNLVWSLDCKKSAGSRQNSLCIYLLFSWSKADSSLDDIYLMYNDL